MLIKLKRVLLIATTSIFVLTCVVLMVLWHYIDSSDPTLLPLPLNIWVVHDLSTAAESIESGHESEALTQLAALNPHNQLIETQRRYLKAICLQSAGSFSESRKDYKYVLDNSIDLNLHLRANLGLFMDKWSLQYVPEVLKRFPSHDSPPGHPF